MKLLNRLKNMIWGLPRKLLKKCSQCLFQNILWKSGGQRYKDVRGIRCHRSFVFDWFSLFFVPGLYFLTICFPVGEAKDFLIAGLQGSFYKTQEQLWPNALPVTTIG